MNSWCHTSGQPWLLTYSRPLLRPDKCELNSSTFHWRLSECFVPLIMFTLWPEMQSGHPIKFGPGQRRRRDLQTKNLGKFLTVLPQLITLLKEMYSLIYLFLVRCMRCKQFDLIACRLWVVEVIVLSECFIVAALTFSLAFMQKPFLFSPRHIIVKRLHLMCAVCKRRICTKQHDPNGNLFALLSPGKQPRFTSRP